MKLPGDTLIERGKLTQYLLVPRKRNDKSKWLAQGGYTLDNWQVLEADIRNLMLSADAKLVEETGYGKIYEIVGKIGRPTGKILSVCTIWMTGGATGKSKFITMYPDKRIF